VQLRGGAREAALPHDGIERLQAIEIGSHDDRPIR
jgi:hypothetical protein